MKKSLAGRLKMRARVKMSLRPGLVLPSFRRLRVLSEMPDSSANLGWVKVTPEQKNAVTHIGYAIGWSLVYTQNH